MAFSVNIVLEPPPESNLVIQRVVVTGEPDKPNVSTLPGFDENLAKKLHACHAQAWSILLHSVSQIMTGATLRTVAKSVFSFNDFQANGVSAVQIKEFMEASLKEQLKALQKNVGNYYAGPGSVNMSSGGKMGSAYRTLDSLYERWQKNEINAMVYAQEAVTRQVALFRAAYDESPFHSNAEKMLARGEYVARWYQMYYGGEPVSTKYAKFLIEQRQDVIDNLILNGN